MEAINTPILHYSSNTPNQSTMSILKEFFAILRGQTNLKEILGWRYFAKKIKPEGNFEDFPTPAAPDYAVLDNWAAHPKKESKASLVPKNTTCQDRQATAKVDCFFVHPTTYFGGPSWNQPPDYTQANEIVDEIHISGQASVFNGCCRIFAPRYRQATFFSFLGAGDNGRKALELAYTDVERAFDYYLQHENNGRPFILAGHSQGSLHLFRLLEEKIDNTPLAQKMVAAYPLGFRLPMDKFEEGVFKTLKPNNAATDIGVIIAWDTYLKTATISEDAVEIWYSTPDGTGRWENRFGKIPLTVNPLSWKRTTEIIAANQNLGAVHFETNRKKLFDFVHVMGDEPLGIETIGLSAPYKAEVGTQVGGDGFLLISKPVNKLFRKLLLPGGNYHNYDYALFYMNIRQNVEERVAIYLKQYAD